MRILFPLYFWRKCVIISDLWLQSKTTFIEGKGLVSVCCHHDFTSAWSYGHGWCNYAIVTRWYQFHTTDAWWFSLNIIVSFMYRNHGVLVFVYAEQPGDFPALSRSLSPSLSLSLPLYIFSCKIMMAFIQTRQPCPYHPYIKTNVTLAMPTKFWLWCHGLPQNLTFFFNNFIICGMNLHHLV